MPEIHQLSQSLINKIAAGEVIERPASVVKELMENAIDSGATRIDVTAVGGGAELIRVVDNGCGIEAEQLPLALACHATSKLAAADDLFRIATMGFRGEALASMAEVSWLLIRSRTAKNSSGAEIDCNGGTISEVVPCGCPAGTTVEARNLFFNMPVRRKGLRNPQTEFGHIKEAFIRVALAMPQLDLTLASGKKAVFELSGSESWQQRIGRLFGRELADNLIWVENESDDVRLSGYVAHPSHSRANNRLQYIFLNGRFIRDRSLQHALGEAYRGLMLGGRFPIAFLNLSMPPEQVDVNVHPTKIEVRFQNSSRHYSQLLSTLRTKFLSTDLHARVRSEENDDPSGAHDNNTTDRLRRDLVDWAKGEVSTLRSKSGTPAAAPSTHGQSSRPMHDDFRPFPDRSFPGGASSGGASSGGASSGGASSDGVSSDGAAGGSLEINRLERQWTPARQDSVPHDAEIKAVQVHNRYILAESEDGVMIVDQHALHERILYEQLRDRIAAGSIETQSLLVPEPVDLAPTESAAALENRELLARLGVNIEPFGGDTILISGYPAMLANINPGEVLRALLERIMVGGKDPDTADVLDELLHTIACKAAVKAGDRLSAAELSSLLEQRHLVKDPHHCPHGRPAALVFSREELDKQFKRL